MTNHVDLIAALRIPMDVTLPSAPELDEYDEQRKVAADALEAAEAKRDHLFDKLELERALTDGAPRRAGKAEAERDALKTKLAEAVEEKLDAISTLDALFDRRELAHDAVDHAVIDAASGYLRTSRVGGMSQKDSDLVLAVIQDMARLSLFADLFARAALAEIKGENHE